jgi:hypothetical protein
MTLTAGVNARRLAIAFAIVVGIALLMGNQRHAYAEGSHEGGDNPPITGSEILCKMNDMDGIHPPVPIFNVDECDEETPPPPPPPPPPPTEHPQCSDGVDNDGDGKIDWQPLPDTGDPGCSTPLDDDESDDPTPPPPPPPAPQCSDGIDNDGDGLIDFGGTNSDGGCTSAEDNDETDPPHNPGGGGTTPQCSDGIDNDSDGLKDFGGTNSDPGCESASDNDETDSVGGSESDPPPAPPGGGGNPPAPTGGGNGSPFIIGQGGGGGVVLGAEDCSQYLTAFIRSGKQNDEDQVRRLQTVLHDFEGAAIDINGIYDTATLGAVNAFQAKYASEVLTPWGISAPTGYVYLTTRKKVNEVYCKGTKQFPLSSDEQARIAQIKSQGVLGDSIQPFGKDVLVPEVSSVEDIGSGVNLPAAVIFGDEEEDTAPATTTTRSRHWFSSTFELIERIIRLGR